MVDNPSEETKKEFELMKKTEKESIAAELGLMLPKNITDKVLNSIEKSMEEGHLHIPKNYSPANALKSAYLEMVGISLSERAGGGLALEKCTKSSIANALLTTVLNGLNPAKKQVYYIPYGTRLDAFVSVFGKMAIAKRIKGVTGEPVARLIYEGDKVEMDHNELGEEIITKHTITFEGKLSGKIVGAYATMEMNGIMRSAVMNIAEIKESWSGVGSNKPVKHEKFTGEFAKRTVIGRLLKPIIQSSDDSYLVMDGGTKFSKENVVEVIDEDTGEITPKPQKLEETTIKEDTFEVEKEEPKVEPKPQKEEETKEVSIKEGKDGQRSLGF